MKALTGLFTAIAVLVLTVAVFGAPAVVDDTNTASTDTTAVVETTDAAEKEEVKVSVAVKDAKVGEVLESLAKQSKEKIIVESTVKGKVTLTVNDLPLESALTALCKSGKFEWRKVYIKPDSDLLEKPDRFASTLRLMTGLSFPDVVLAGSSNDRVGVHCEDKKAVKKLEKLAEEDLKMTRAYLITNDAAIAAKALAKDEGDDESKSDAVEEYTSSSKRLMDLFMEMTPEEREMALLEALNLMDQAGPGYMASVMQTMMDANPQVLREMVGRQTQMLFDMSEQERRRMMRLNMEIMRMITPEQRQMLEEDGMAVIKQMQEEGIPIPGMPEPE